MLLGRNVFIFFSTTHERVKSFTECNSAISRWLPYTSCLQATVEESRDRSQWEFHGRCVYKCHIICLRFFFVHTYQWNSLFVGKPPHSPLLKNPLKISCQEKHFQRKWRSNVITSKPQMGSSKRGCYQQYPSTTKQREAGKGGGGE